MATFEQLPSRSYPVRSRPGQSLAHGASIPLGLAYPDGEQLPKQSYPLGSHPLWHLSHIRQDAPLGLTYPDGEQLPKRAYPLGSHPLWHLSHIGGSSAARLADLLGDGKSYRDRQDRLEKPECWDDEEICEMMAMIQPYL